MLNAVQGQESPEVILDLMSKHICIMMGRWNYASDWKSKLDGQLALELDSKWISSIIFTTRSRQVPT
ncbi:hypothetical protein VTO42DRAFT_7667 [Malbranchea cinnamomea]